MLPSSSRENWLQPESEEFSKAVFHVADEIAPGFGKPALPSGTQRSCLSASMNFFDNTLTISEK